MIRVEHIEVSAAPGRRVALVVLDRADKRNALTPDSLANIEAVAHEVRAGAGKADAVVLAGEGPVFCAGFDLELCADDPAMTAALMTRLSHAVRALRRLPAPVVVAAHGAAIAGGCALLGGGDVVVTDRSAKIGYPVARLGMSPAVSAPTVRRAVAGGGLRRLMLDPGLISGAEAARLGLVHELVEEPADVRGRAIEIAESLAAKPTHGLHATKRWLNEVDGSDEDDEFEGALAASLAITGGDEERALLSAAWGRER